MIGARLKTARAASGLSLRELEHRIGKRVTAQMIGKYERDETMPSSDVLMVLAEALGVSEEFLLSDGNLALEMVEFRKKAATSVREQAQLEGQTLHLLSRYLAIEGVLGLSSIWDKPREAPYPISAVADAESAANAVRIHWGLGVDPIPCIVELFEERGVKVLSVPLSDISGMTAKVRRVAGEPVPVVVVSHSDWSERKRFTLAHELGHMVMDTSSLGSEKDAERAAHRFAGAFLMPAEALWREIGKRRSSISLGELLSLKHLFGASFQAITYRCRDLGLINDHLFRRLFQEFGKRGWRSAPFKEPGAIDPSEEQPRRLERLSYRALAEGLIGEARAAEIIGISVRDLNARMDAASTS
ncbi:MAG: ImmA/IrrE family metallo-endopeptidase [Betaproteobacteria bacterium]|nr:ImmA/IrrE family metallo-endopeptidase [Betaproteobacteria bacterium]